MPLLLFPRPVFCYTPRPISVSQSHNTISLNNVHVTGDANTVGSIVHA